MLERGKLDRGVVEWQTQKVLFPPDIYFEK